MQKDRFDSEFAKAIKAGQKREYNKAITILEKLVAEGAADAASANGAEGGHPEVYQFLARSWHAAGNFTRAVSYARLYVRLMPEDAAGWFFLGRSCLSDSLIDRGIHALRTSLQFNPRSVDAHTLLGMAYLKSRKPTLARAVFEAGLAIAPEDPRLNQGYLNSLFVEAVRILKRGDAENARQMLTFLINNDIDGVAPRLYLAHALRELGYLPEALSQYAAATEFAPEDETLRWYAVSIMLEMGDAEGARELMAQLGSPPEDVQVSDKMVDLIIIRNHLEAEEWAKAAQAARMYIKTRGADPRVHALMGEAQRNLGNTEKAVNHFNRALALDKKDPSPWYGILMTLCAAKDWPALADAAGRASRAGCDKETVTWYRVLAGGHLDVPPEELLPAIQDEVRRRGAIPELLAILARTYLRLDMCDLAVGWYQKVLSLDENNEDAWLGLMVCCETLEMTDDLMEVYSGYLERWDDNCEIRREYIEYLATREDWATAAVQSEQLARFEPSDQLDRQMAFYRRKAGQFREAAILYRNMLRKKPEEAALLHNLVFCLDRMGERERACALMREANRLFKVSAESLLIEASLLARKKDWDSALTVFRQVIDKWPKDPRAWERVADIYRLQGVPEMAATFLQTARDLRAAATGRKKRSS